MDISLLGLPKAKTTQFRNKGINTINELLRLIPKSYYDFRAETPIALINDKDIVSVIGKVMEIKQGNTIRVKIHDGRNHMYIVWFGANYITKQLQIDKVYNFCGLVNIDEEYGTKQMVNPFYFSDDLDKFKRLMPQYPKIKGMSESYLINSIDTSLRLLDSDYFTDYAEQSLLDKFGIISQRDAYLGIHKPVNIGQIENAKDRLLFDALFSFAFRLKAMHHRDNDKSLFVMPKANTVNPFLKTLGFELTSDQLNTVRSIYKDMKTGKRVSALVQGDVGSGKTIVAFLLMLIASENKYQSALMAPTNVLAKQHYEELKTFGERMGYKVAFLSGETKAKEKREILKELKSGDIDMLVGTHAIISSGVEFNNLALSIVDEEHRFGVAQRKLINEKTNSGVHSITMSATPIPRSLAMTIYGDNTEVYNIVQMPKGRKPIITKLTKNDTLAYEFMIEEIKNGRQCYIVCPLIEESESEVMQGVLSVDEVYKRVSNFHRGKGFNISVINGNMKQEEIAREIALFLEGKTHIIISTTIIEVGVNVPNSTVMIIQNAERFGLAQLHQLRGRVGRGSHQSYCVLVSKESENPKLNAMVRTTNGFEIAEEDLKLRGAGDFLGTKQSGNHEDVMLMLAYPVLFGKIKKEIDEIYEDKKRLEHYNGLLN